MAGRLGGEFVFESGTRCAFAAPVSPCGVLRLNAVVHLALSLGEAPLLGELVLFHGS